MVLPEARAELREALTTLVAGRLSNDDFDDVYYRLCVQSPDRAVEEIGEFGWGLYSSDLLWPYYLSGRHAVSAEARAAAERCDLFLKSGLEYEWPLQPRLTWVQFAQALAVTPAVLVAWFAAGAVILAAVSNSGWGVVVVLAVVTVLAVVAGVWGYRRLSRYARRREAEYWNGGPQEVWPFFSEAAFGHASVDRAAASAASDDQRIQHWRA